MQLILAGASCRAAAEACHGIGCNVTSIDFFGDADLRSCSQCHVAKDWQELGEQILSQPPAKFLPCGGLENHPAIWSAAAERHTLLGPTVEQLIKLRDPFWLHEFLAYQRCRLQVPPTTTYTAGGAIPPGWLWKSLASAGGLRVSPFVLGDAQAASIIQQQVFGHEYGVTILCEPDVSQIVAITSSLSAWTSSEQRPFCYTGSVGPRKLEPQAVESITAAAKKLGGELNFTGILQMDVIVAEDGVWLLEINPRWTAGMEIDDILHPGRLVSSFLKYRSRKFDSNFFENCWNCAAKRILYAARTLTIDPSRLTNMTCWQNARTDVQYRLADIPDRISVIEAGHPICTVLHRARQQLCNQFVPFEREHSYEVQQTLCS